MDNIPKTLMEQLKMENVRTLETVTAGAYTIPLLIDGEEIEVPLPEGTLACHLLPHYRGNPGFFHLFCGGGECLLLKACYHDGIRYLKKGIPLGEDILIDVSKAMLQVEGIAKAPHAVWAAVTPTGEVYIAKAVPVVFDVHTGLDPMIPRPLTVGEYDYNGSAYDENLLSRSLFHTVLPECLSFMGASLLKKYPDILHSYFLAFEAKVQSPSQQVIDGRAYMNLSGVLSAMREAKTDRKAFAASFIPWQKIFDKDRPVKPELFSIEYIPMEEVSGFVETLKKQIASAGGYSFFEETYTEPVMHLTMLQMMLYFIFQEQWLYLVSLTGMDKTEILRWIYTTRASSPFFKGGEFNLPLFFDPALESLAVTIKSDGKAIQPGELLEKLSAFTRLKNKKKILSMLKEAHLVLDMRDTVTALAGEYHKKSRAFMMENAGYLKDKGRFNTPEDLFMVDMTDFRKLVHDTYYSGLQQIIQYRASYQCRIGAQVMPYEMYAGDIRYSWRITEEQLVKFDACTSFPCSAYNASEMTGEVHACSTVGRDMTGKIACARAFTLPMIAGMGKPAALITDMAPIFSYMTEYALIYDIPLYSGVRYGELLLSGKTVTFEKERITIQQ